MGRLLPLGRRKLPLRVAISFFSSAGFSSLDVDRQRRDERCRLTLNSCAVASTGARCRSFGEVSTLTRFRGDGRLPRLLRGVGGSSDAMCLLASRCWGRPWYTKRT